MYIRGIRKDKCIWHLVTGKNCMLKVGSERVIFVFVMVSSGMVIWTKHW
jgi:hypothetical protein